jgi:hypothetical protein
MKTKIAAMLYATILSTGACGVEAQVTAPEKSTNSSLASVFGNLVAAGNNGPAMGSVYAYAARPEFSQPVLSPQGGKVAMVTRLSNSVTTLLVVDISGDTAKPVMKLDVPYMKAVRQFGWASETSLVAWLDMDTSQSSDDDPTSTLYMAMIDLTTKKVTERVQAQKMEQDAEAGYPLSSELVRAPYRQSGHVLINECKRQSNGHVFKQRGDEVNFTFATTQTLSSNVIRCELRDWNVVTNISARVVRPFYAFPTRSFADANGNSFFTEGRKLGGKIIHGEITPDSANKKKWTTSSNADQTELESIWDNNELDNPALWRNIHDILKNRLDPQGTVVKTSNNGQAIGLQFDAPEQRFVALDGVAAAVNEVVEKTFAGTQTYAGSNIHWLGSTDDHGVVLFSVESLTNPGSYFIWRKSDNTIMRITDVRASSANSLADNYLEPGWLPGYVPSAVTVNTRSKIKGFVLMPQIMTDDSANNLLRTVDMTAQWFAMNGLVTVRVPVGLPSTLPTNQRGDVWRKQIATRINSVIKNLKLDYAKTAEQEVPFCLYGRDINAYAALAAQAFGAATTCTIAINPKLDPKLFAQPYVMINNTDKTRYVSSDNVELRLWRSVYGDDVAAGTPGNWIFPNTADVMVSFEMFEDNSRAISTYDGTLKSAITKAGGRYTDYSPFLMAARTDQWLANQYDEMISFILPPDAKKIGKVVVGELEDKDNVVRKK